MPSGPRPWQRAAMDLKALIGDPSCTIAAIGAALDALPHEERLAQTRTLSRGAQRLLYEKAAASPPAALEDFVPEGNAPRAPVRHSGRNTLPVFRLFEKRFCVPESGAGRLFGYNEGPTRKLVGPGYFVAHPTAGNAEWERRGAVVIDYFQVPDGPVAEGWPAVVPNSRGLQALVYDQTRDFMRKVSRHVTIGAAYKREKAIGAWFVLCREDA